MLNNKNLNDPNLLLLIIEKDKGHYLKFFNEKKEEICNSLLNHLINDNNCLINCSKHLLRHYHLTSTEKIGYKKRILVYCKKSMIESIIVFYDIFQYINNNNSKNNNKNNNIYKILN